VDIVSESVLDTLRRKISSVKPAVSTHPLDVPPVGSLIEWCGSAGMGAATSCLSVVRKALVSHAGLWVIIDPAEEFFPEPAWGWGVPLERTLVVRPEPGDFAWSVEHCLRSPAVAVTWCGVDPRHDRMLRRWKRAAEIGGGIGMLFRAADQKSTGTGVDVRWRCCKGQASGAGRDVTVQLDYCRGSFQGGMFDLQVHDAEGRLSLVPQLADSARAARAARA
jgi:hypothetical protein